MALDDFSNRFYNIIENDSRVVSGLPFNLPSVETMKDYFKLMKITPEFKYRPDKLALDIWGDEDASYILNYINGFKNIKDYYVGRYIYYIEENDLYAVGLK